MSAGRATLLGGADAATAVVDGESGQHWSVAALRGAAASTNAAIATAIGARRALVFLRCRNDLPTLIGYLAAVEHGYPVALLDAAMETGAFASLVDRYRPAVVLGGADAPGGYRRGAPAADGPSLFVRIESDDPPVAASLAVLLSTSGSTGSPKFVRLSHDAVLANAQQIATALGIQPTDRAISALPMHYSYGLSVINSHLAAGASIVITERNLLEDAYWDLMRSHDVTSMAGVPYTYQLLRRLDLGRLNVPAVRTLTVAGGRLDPKLVAVFHAEMTARQGQFFVMYGQTEATARITICPSADWPTRQGSVGRPIPGGTIEIVDADGEACAVGTSGEVIYRGPNVMLGYAEGPADLAAGDLQHGRLATGDIGYLDADGFLFITGRLKRIAKAFGYRINLDEIESALAGRGPVAAVCIDERVVVYCPGWNADAMQQAQADLAQLTHVHTSAFQFRTIEVLPVLPSGKTDYAALSQGS